MTKRQLARLGFKYNHAKLPTYDLRDSSGKIVSSVYAHRVEHMSISNFMVHLCQTQKNIGFREGYEQHKKVILNALGL